MTMTSHLYSVRGASFSEVLVAMALTMVGLMGAMGAFHASGRSIAQGTLAAHALALVESRIEAKRSVRWEQLLMDDLDHDGVPEMLMHDDGAGSDRAAGDGIFSAAWEHDGVLLTWTVAPNRPGSLSHSGFAILEASAMYASSDGQHEVRVATIRANPMFAGSH